MTDHMDPSKYFVVSIREYDEMKSEIERLRKEIRRLQGILGDVLGERDHWKWSATGNE